MGAVPLSKVARLPEFNSGNLAAIVDGDSVKAGSAPPLSPEGFAHLQPDGKTSRSGVATAGVVNSNATEARGLTEIQKEGPTLGLVRTLFSKEPNLAAPLIESLRGFKTAAAEVLREKLYEHLGPKATQGKSFSLEGKWRVHGSALYGIQDGANTPTAWKIRDDYLKIHSQDSRTMSDLASSLEGLTDSRAWKMRETLLQMNRPSVDEGIVFSLRNLDTPDAWKMREQILARCQANPDEWSAGNLGTSQAGFKQPRVRMALASTLVELGNSTQVQRFLDRLELPKFIDAHRALSKAEQPPRLFGSDSDAVVVEVRKALEMETTTPRAALETLRYCYSKQACELRGELILSGEDATEKWVRARNYINSPHPID